MATFSRNTILATNGNLPIKPSGEPIFDTDGGLLVMNGEIAVFNPKTGVTMDAAAIATADKVAVAVGVGSHLGLAEDIRFIGPERTDLCTANICGNVTSPSCGIPQVKDLFFSIDTDKNRDIFSFQVFLDDNYVRSNYDCNEPAMYPFSVALDDVTCDTCEGGLDEAELTCKIAAAINNTHKIKDPTKLTRFINSGYVDQYQPFRALPLYKKDSADGANNTIKKFCLSLSDDSCENCAYLSGITGITIGNDTTTFVGTTDPKDSTKSLPSQVKRIVSEINKALEPTGGGAVLQRGLGNCCEYMIEVSTCVPSVVLTSDGGDISPTEEYNPFNTVYVEKECKSCNSSLSGTDFVSGVRLYVDPVEVDCLCDLPPNIPALNYYGRTIEIHPVGDGWDCGSFLEVETCAQELPEGFGYYYSDQAHYKQHNGGSGRDFKYYNYHVGDIGLPDETSRARLAPLGIDCNETYCITDMIISVESKARFSNSRHYSNTEHAVLLIPEKDQVTKDSWHEVLEALKGRGVCCNTMTSVCGRVVSDKVNVSTTVGVAATYDVSANDDITCNAGAITYELVAGSETNATVTNSGATFSITATQEGNWEFAYRAYCDGDLVGTATVRGHAIPA